MFGGMMSLLGGIGTGYNQGVEQQKEDNRRDALLAIEQARANRAQTEFDQQQSEGALMRQAAAPVAAAPDMITSADGSDVQNTVPAPSTDSIDVGQPGTAPALPTSTVQGVSGLTPTQATMATTQANSPAAVTQRQAQVQSGLGNPAQAAKLQEAAQHMTDEGHVRFIEDNFANAPSAADIAAGNTNFALVGVDKFNKTGGTATIPDGSQGQAFISTLPNGQQQVDYRVIGPDGQPVTQASARQFLSFAQQNQTQRDASDRATYLDKENQADKAASLTRLDAEQKERVRHDTAMEGIYGAKNVVAAGRVGKADHFDEKEWDAINKVEPSYVTFDDPNGGKPIESPELRLTYQTLVNEARSSGTMAPNEASEYAKTKLVQLRSKAQAISDASAGSDKPVTPQQVVQQLLKAAQVVPAPAKPAAPPPPKGPTMQAVSAPPVPAPPLTGGAAGPDDSAVMGNVDLGQLPSRVASMRSTMQSEGQAYNAIDARVRQAGSGGPPLTAQEKAAARQFGIATP